MVRRGAFELYPLCSRTTGDEDELSFVDNIHEREEVALSEDGTPTMRLMASPIGGVEQSGMGIVFSLFNHDFTQNDILAIGTLLNVLSFLLSLFIVLRHK